MRPIILTESVHKQPAQPVETVVSALFITKSIHLFLNTLKFFILPYRSLNEHLYMMKKLLLLLLLPSACFAQNPVYPAEKRPRQTGTPTPMTRDDVRNHRVTPDRLYWGYQTAVKGWVIRQGDTLQLGKGTMPDKRFAFIFQPYEGYPLTTLHTDKVVRVKELRVIGTEKSGYTLVAVINLGVKYWIQVDNAIESGELLPPNQYQNTAVSMTSGSVADEIKKFKDLLDTGAITQEEFDSQKKKLLNQ